MATVAQPKLENMRTLPGDAVRQIQWRFADRFELQMLVQSARGVARGPVARLVAAGERHSHDWTPGKNELLAAFDAAGITGVFMDPLQTLEPITTLTGPALKNEMMLPAVLDPWASHALYEAANLAAKNPQGMAGEPGAKGQAATGDDDRLAEGAV